MARKMPKRRRRIVYLQYSNPGAYPPLAHSSRILAGQRWQVLLVGIGAFGSANELAVQTLWATLRWRPDWIYVSDPLACPAALPLAYLGSWQILYHEHDSPKADESRNHRPFMRAVLGSRSMLARKAALCVLPNAKRAEMFKARTGITHAALTVLNCPSLEEISPGHSSADSGFIVFYHGSIVPSRVPLALVRAIARLPPNAVLRIVGYETIENVGYLQALECEASRLGIADRVQYLGVIRQRKDLLSECRRAHVGVSLMPLASDDLNEREMTGASNKAFDYLACGVPLLVSQLPAWETMFVEPGYAVSCDPDDSESIVEALRWLIDHPVDRGRMGLLGMSRILRDWNYEAQFEPVRDRLEHS